MKKLFLLLSLLITLSTYSQTIPSNGSINSSGCIQCDSLNIGDSFSINGNTMIVVNRPMLDSMVTGQYDVTKACVSHITDFSNTFNSYVNFNQNIYQWDVSNAVDISSMFQGTRYFNYNIGNWDVSNVQNFKEMFRGSDNFNQDISGWDVSSVTGAAAMEGMFRASGSFNQNLSTWCVLNITSTPSFFNYSSGLSSNNLPNWGTCPNGIISVTFNNATIIDTSSACQDSVKVPFWLYNDGQQPIVFSNQQIIQASIYDDFEGGFHSGIWSAFEGVYIGSNCGYIQESNTLIYFGSSG